MNGLVQSSETEAGRGPGFKTWSGLSFTLAGFGMAASTAAALFTYALLHEPLESVGAAVVSHLTSAKCTAIAQTLAGLSIARSDTLNGAMPEERTEPDRSTVIGVVTPATWGLDQYHAQSVSPQQSLRILQQLPGLGAGGSPAAAADVTSKANSALTGQLQRHRCTELAYGLSPQAVRVYAVPSPLRDQRRQSRAAERWIALLYGPWPAGGQQKFAFALVDLHDSTLEISGHHQSLAQLFPAGGGKLQMRVTVGPAAVLAKQLTQHTLSGGLNLDDQKLAGLRIVPFANQMVSTELGVDHGVLDRLSRCSALFVLAMGLLATAAVVVVSRRSEVALRRLNEILLRESRTDGLTRVANRRAWDEALSMEESRRQRHGHRYGLIVVDLDDFKQINDQQGHLQGDQVLQTAASLLVGQLRSTDVLARVGGDEFALLIFNPSADGLQDLCERLHEALEEAGIRASIGSALSEPQTTLDQTWAEADAAMYQVKTSEPSTSVSVS